ncbi:MAG TPA: pitrilysin family protein [Thermoanaerobaculia bacterium]|nr:pitrilysin family protein [Thermoanaerobaculia bacterium]
MLQRIGLIALALVFVVSSTVHAQFFPYPVQKRTLPNGLDVIVIETPEFRDVLSFNTLILAGSGRENEKGRSGLAHLFEHIVFRHDHDTPQAYQASVEEMGAFNNAYTWYDVTYYHPLTFTSNLERLAALEGSRFRELRYTERVFRTEAGAVYGEYRRIASNPGLKIEEVLSDLMYGPAHGYGHSTIGYLDDIQDMPNAYRSAVAFYNAYYRPNNAIVVVAGDVDPEEVFKVVEKHYGTWERRAIPEQPPPGPVNGPQSRHEEWPAQIPPRVLVSYRVPAFVPGTPESATIQVMSELMGGETAPLYRNLRFEQQVATTLGVASASAMGFHARPLSTYITVAEEKYKEEGRPLLDRMAKEVATAFEGLSAYSSQPDAASRLEAIKSQLRFDILASLNSPANIAENFATLYRFSRDPKIFEKVSEAIARLTPADIDAFAKAHFRPANRVTVTLAPQGGAR